MSETIIVIGEAGEQRGAYLLRLLVERDLALRFGRFAGGRPLPVPAGVYVYVGSAMGRQGASSLAHRLLRHATRSTGAPQPVRAEMAAGFRDVGLGPADLRPPRRKTLFWHVDYLLEETAVALTHVLVWRSGRRLEDAIARLLLADEETAVLWPGLGASDARGQTHLLRAPQSLTWWRETAERLRAEQ